MRETEGKLRQSNIRRWRIRRKAALLEALQKGAVSVEKASERYELSVEELRTWERDFERYGVYGLRTTRVQIYRGVRSSSRLKKTNAVKRQVAGTAKVESGRLKQLEEENAKLKQLVADLGSNKAKPQHVRRKNS
jgi:hypothetical protein